jgi:hypothetical protein
MSLTEVMNELSLLTTEERQLVISRALELDEPPFTAEDELLIESRRAAHRAQPETAVPFDEMMSRVKDRLRR